MKLRLENYVKRAPDRSARHEPSKPLTEKQKQILAEKCLDKCTRAYLTRMRTSALLSDFEELEELKGEAYIAMWNIINKFDISKCGALSKFDIPGAKSPKTLEFYFLNYFYGRVNFIAAEARAYKKQRGVGPVDSIEMEVDYNPITSSQDMYTEHDHKYEVTGFLLKELKTKSMEFQRFFHQRHTLECTQRELREEYGEKFNELKDQVEGFFKEIKKRYPQGMKV